MKFHELLGINSKLIPLGDLRLQWEGDIKMNLKKRGCFGVDWIEMDLIVGFGFHRNGISRLAEEGLVAWD